MYTYSKQSLIQLKSNCKANARERERYRETKRIEYFKRKVREVFTCIFKHSMINSYDSTSTEGTSLI